MDFPADFLRHLEGLPGYVREDFLYAHEHAGPVTSIRLNPGKLKDPSLLHFVNERLQPVAGNESLLRIPWSSWGYYLPCRPYFTFDPLFHAGGYYVQEASSMLLEHICTSVLSNGSPLRVLDLCAAPGGKSTLLQSIMTPDSLLVANETIRSRVPILVENLTKWGASNVAITHNDPADFACLPHFFDVLLIDAPCSGSGLFRKDPTAMGEWSLGNVALCSQRQQRIIADAWPCLKPGGLLLYATCSFSQEENEAIADWLLSEKEAESLAIAMDPSWSITESRSQKYDAAGYRCWPNHANGEGFYIACFRKTEEENLPKVLNRRKKSTLLSPVKAGLFYSWLQAADELFFCDYRDHIHFFPGECEADLQHLLDHPIKLVQFGVKMGKQIRGELVPDAALAFCNNLSTKAVRRPLNLEQSLHYLRRDEIILDRTGQESGWALATYQELGLGWLKLLHNRINNYFPKEWRILRDPFQ